LGRLKEKKLTPGFKKTAELTFHLTLRTAAHFAQLSPLKVYTLIYAAKSLSVKPLKIFTGKLF